MFIWRKYFDTYWAVSHGALILKVTNEGRTFVLPPFGGVDEELPLVVESLKDYFHHEPFEFHGVYDTTIERFKKYLPEVTEYTEDRDNWDYVYSREKLATLSGRKYHGKKNHYNAFIKDHPDFVYEPITPANAEECIAFGMKWDENRAQTDPTILSEKSAIVEGLRNIEALQIRGGLIRLDGEVKAFTFGERVSEETAVVHIEKADPDIRGLFTAINKEYVERTWSDVKYINREEDMGIPGMRKAKESYHPEFMVKKYNTIIS
ncbi:MAG: phosphatidylglycerol lysyltransferase domain-containing protein [Acidaminococcus sp.]|nr:phosphatidylglycerol lysyltransferase domain-containing protein [Acidaminococcus sp.]MCI2099484.1 phosphatidylglycerol lysyltransferase domain-containing protein [Acidaminococcus sp.]MCI2113844.1 phosphatidylglycerol lysyltransferase domain-containing protein [Acidaminococcus sp.]MCI2115582.1 phosphatidylglycerol lysyltransferase domain-containing protein [Acidaminococcus sp.]